MITTHYVIITCTDSHSHFHSHFHSHCVSLFTVPDFHSFHEHLQIKLTTSSILREDALYKKKQAEEAKFLKAYEEELRDQSEFIKWQSKVRAADELARATEIERRKQDARQAEVVQQYVLLFHFYYH